MGRGSQRGGQRGHQEEYGQFHGILTCGIDMGITYAFSNFC